MNWLSFLDVFISIFSLFAKKTALLRISLFNRLYSDMVTILKNAVFYAKSEKMDINTNGYKSIRTVISIKKYFEIYISIYDLQEIVLIPSTIILRLIIRKNNNSSSSVFTLFTAFK